MRWYTRAYMVVRAALSRIGVLRAPPPAPGISQGRVARAISAESDLRMMAMSPTVYAAVNRRAWTLANFPVIGQYEGKTLDPKRTPWLADLRALLAQPVAADTGGLFPTETGERLLAQLVADLLLVGTAYCAVAVAGGRVTSLHRLHPATVTLERRGDGEYWVHKVSGREMAYPRDTVACLRMLSWEASGAGEIGTGAAEPLRALVEAEYTALSKTAAVVGQGGADVMIKGTSPASRAFLSVPANREAVAREMTTALGGGLDGSRRVFVLGGELDVEDAGFKPADLQATETLSAARDAELMALGATPISVGSEASTYATALAQYRVQAENDEMLASIIEAALLRPLARHFARTSGGRWAGRAEGVTARIDLSSHPGNVHVRSEQIERVERLVGLGWSPEQAAEAEGLDLPRPDGKPREKGAEPGPVSSGPGGEPAPAMGDRLLSSIFRREVQARPSTAMQWRAVEAKRARSDAALETVSAAQLDVEAETYSGRALAVLGAAERMVRGEQRAVYAPFDMDAILGDRAEAVQGWVDALREEWATSWREAAARAGEQLSEAVPSVDLENADYQTLEASAAAVADYSRERVRALVEEGTSKGWTSSEIATQLRGDEGFKRPRALRIARTETVRAQSSGENARWKAAQDFGLELDQEWLANPNARPSHASLDGVVVPVGESWTFPSGLATPGPGLSGDPGEDINCRCGRVVRERTGGRDTEVT